MHHSPQRCQHRRHKILLYGYQVSSRSILIHVYVKVSIYAHRTFALFLTLLNILLSLISLILATSMSLLLLKRGLLLLLPLLTFAMLLRRASSSSVILVLLLPITRMLLVEAPLFFFGTQLLSHLPVLPSRLLNSLLSPSNFSTLS